MHGMLSFYTYLILFTRLFADSDIEHKPIAHLNQQRITLNYIPRFKETHRSCYPLPLFLYLYWLALYLHQHHPNNLPRSKMFRFIFCPLSHLCYDHSGSPPSPSIPKGTVRRLSDALPRLFRSMLSRERPLWYGVLWSLYAQTQQDSCRYLPVFGDTLVI